MDAIVFFAAATMISSALILFVSSWPQATEEWAGTSCPDAAAMLDTLLRVSIGREVEISSTPLMTIPSSMTVYDCLAAELYALDAGVDPHVFAELNEVIMSAAESVCGNALAPCIMILDPELSVEEPLLAIPQVPQGSSVAYASSSEMPRTDGSQVIVTLVLCPTLLPELPLV